MIDSLVKLRRDRFVLLVVVIGFVVCPGFGFLFVFDHDAFASLDFSKLLMLSLTITTPIFLLNFFLAYTYLWMTKGISSETIAKALPKDLENYEQVVKEHRGRASRERSQTYDAATAIASILSIVPLYIPFGMKLIFEVSARAGIISITVTEIIVAAGSIAIAIWKMQSSG